MSKMKDWMRSFILDADKADPPLTRAQCDDRSQLAIDIMEASGLIVVADVEDTIGVTTAGRDFAGILPEGVPALPVQIAEITGNIAESELAARYLEGKVLAVDSLISNHQAPGQERSMSWEESYQHTAIVLRETAKELRAGLHHPTVHVEGRVIPYNEDRSTGISHATALQTFFADVYARNLKAGWWTNIEDGTPKKRNVGELFVLMVTELVEAYKAYFDGSPDDKLPEYPGLGVEMGDLLIRIADFCGALQAGNIIAFDPLITNPGQQMFMEIAKIADSYEAIRKTPHAVGDPETADHIAPQDVGIMVDAKLAFNAKREDHKIENRLKEDGKRT